MSAGGAGEAAEAAQGRGGAPEAGRGEAVKGGPPEAAAQPAGDNSHESGATAAPCADELRSNLSFRQRLSETEAAPADRAAAAQPATPKAVVPQQAGAWSAVEQQRWWQHLQVAVSVPMDPPDAAMQDAAAQRDAGADAGHDGGSGEAAAKSASGLTHTDRTTQSDCSGPGSAPAAMGADTAATAQSMRAEGRKRKARPGRGPGTDRSPGGSPLSPPRARTYSLNDGAVHYGKEGDHAAQPPAPRNGFSPQSPAGEAAPGFSRRSGGSESGGGGGFVRRSGGSDPGIIGRRGSGSANAAHYAALEEKVQRRLRQNREAAQRSRQRKKAYMAALEAEIKSGKSQEEALAAVRPAKAPRRSCRPSWQPSSPRPQGGPRRLRLRRCR